MQNYLRTPFRKVRCPTLEDLEMETHFRMQDISGNYMNCTQDTILLARGPLIIGFDRNGTICPIRSSYGHEIIYDEITNKQHRVTSEFLRRLGVFQPVPVETLRLREIHPFGMYILSSSSSSSESGPGSDFGSDSSSSIRSSASSSVLNRSSSHRSGPSKK